MDGDALARMGLTLALLLAVPATLLWVMRHFGLRLPGALAGGSRLQVVERTAIDAKHVLLLIRRDAQEQLLLLGPAGPTILEGVIRLSPDDKAEQARQQSAREERVAAVRTRAEQLSGLPAVLLAAVHERLKHAAAPSFARMVERRGARPVRRPAKSRTRRA